MWLNDLIGQSYGCWRDMQSSKRQAVAHHIRYPAAKCLHPSAWKVQHWLWAYSTWDRAPNHPWVPRWLLILCVNLTGQGMTDKTLSLDVSLKVGLVKQITLPNVGEHHPIHWRPKWNKRRRRNLPLVLLPVRAGTSHLIFSCPQTGIYTIASPGAQAFRFRLHYITSFPNPP